MAAQKGLEMLLKVDSDGAGTYQTLGGIQTNGLTLDKETVDITSQDEVDRYRKLIAGAGVKSMSISGSGVFKDDAAIETARSYYANDTLRNWRITIPSFYDITANFAVSRLEFSGAHNGEVTFSISLDSSGPIAWTPI